MATCIHVPVAVNPRCSCDYCITMPTQRENKCCKNTNIVDGKIEEADLNCITEHEGFIANCLNRYVLETSFYEFRQENGPLDEQEEPIHEEMVDYPINIFTCTYRDDIVKTHDDIDEFGKNGNWSELVEILKVHEQFVNSSKLPVKNKGQPPLFTPLHYAASGGAPKEIFEQLIEIGASKCLKTATGETAYDIATTKGLNPDILKLLKMPKKIKQNANEIEKMEKGLHKVIKGRVKDLIKDNGQALPQLALLYEKGSFHYPVPGMYGGFIVSEHEKGIQADSSIRICGGSERNHLIKRDGTITLLPNEYPM